MSLTLPGEVAFLLGEHHLGPRDGLGAVVTRNGPALGHDPVVLVQVVLDGEVLTPGEPLGQEVSVSLAGPSLPGGQRRLGDQFVTNAVAGEADSVAVVVPGPVAPVALDPDLLGSLGGHGNLLSPNQPDTVSVASGTT